MNPPQNPHEFYFDSNPFQLSFSFQLPGARSHLSPATWSRWSTYKLPSSTSLACLRLEPVSNRLSSDQIPDHSNRTTHYFLSITIIIFRRTFHRDSILPSRTWSVSLNLTLTLTLTKHTYCYQHGASVYSLGFPFQQDLGFVPTARA